MTTITVYPNCPCCSYSSSSSSSSSSEGPTACIAEWHIFWNCDAQEWEGPFFDEYRCRNIEDLVGAGLLNVWFGMTTSTVGDPPNTKCRWRIFIDSGSRGCVEPTLLDPTPTPDCSGLEPATAPTSRPNQGECGCPGSHSGSSSGEGEYFCHHNWRVVWDCATQSFGTVTLTDSLCGDFFDQHPAQGWVKYQEIQDGGGNVTGCVYRLITQGTARCDVNGQCDGESPTPPAPPENGDDCPCSIGSGSGSETPPEPPEFARMAAEAPDIGIYTENYASEKCYYEWMYEIPVASESPSSPTYMGIWVCGGGYLPNPNTWVEVNNDGVTRTFEGWFESGNCVNSSCTNTEPPAPSI